MAIGQTATSRSTYSTMYAAAAVDGNYGSVTCTADSAGQSWWSVDLGCARNVFAVNVTNDYNINTGKGGKF